MYDLRAQLFAQLTSGQKANTSFQNAVSRSQYEDYRLQREHWLPGMRTRAALALTKLVMIPRINRSLLFERIITTLRSVADPFNPSHSRVLNSLAIDAEMQPLVLTEVNNKASEVETSRTSSESKVEALVRLSRLLAPISETDARNLFNRSIVVSSELNEEAINELAVFEPLVRRGATALTVDDRRTGANKLGAVAGDAWIRLDRPEGFPWQKVARAVSILDVNLALAFAARWEDQGVVNRSRLCRT